WFTASVKFFVPFSLLMGLGGQWASTTETFATETVAVTIAEITEPFSEPLLFTPSTPQPTDWIAIAILALWLCGFLAVALARLRGWLLIRAAVRSSAAIDIAAPVEVRSSPGLLEP